MNSFQSPNAECKAKSDKCFQIPATPFLKPIGYGTGVRVYHWDRSTQDETECSPWALKKITKWSSRSTVSRRMKTEANILKNLNHPNIIGFRAYSESDIGHSVLAMEECGISLGDLIEERRENKLGPLEPKIISKVIYSVCNALHYLHTEHKIIHGDLKSFNILIKGHFEEVKLCDFGVSFPIDENGRVKFYVGTLCWSAPEVLGAGPITPKADIYALGLTIWEMLTLVPPHSRATGEITNESFTNDTSLALPESEYEDSIYGSRPNIPDNLGDEYNIIIDILKWCTEVEHSSRPNPVDIINKYQTCT